MPPIRVVHLGKYYPPASGGIEGHTQTLARAQAALGADVTVVVVNHADTAGRDVTFKRFVRTRSTEESDGAVRVIRVGRRANIAKMDVVPGLRSTLRRLLQNPPDVWHMHTPNITMMLSVLSLPKIRPLVITHHSDIVRQRVLKYAVRPLENALYRQATQILSDSPGYIDLSPLLKKHIAKVSVLPLGIDAAPYRQPSSPALEFANELRAKHGSPLWLCVGRLIYYKGLSVAIEALKDTVGKLMIVGTGPLEMELRKHAKELGVENRVVFFGHATPSQIAGAYQASTALWFPSIARSEGFGLVQVEAMASGCPVINTNIPGSGVPWVCRHEYEGLTVPVNDAPALATAANRLQNEAGFRERLAKAGSERATAEFVWMVMGQRSLDIYRRVILDTNMPVPHRNADTF